MINLYNWTPRFNYIKTEHFDKGNWSSIYILMGRFHFSHIKLFNRCLHEIGTKNCSDRSESQPRSLDRTDYQIHFRPVSALGLGNTKRVSAGVYIVGYCALGFGKNACSRKNCLLKDLWYSYRSRVNILKISIFILDFVPGLGPDVCTGAMKTWFMFTYMCIRWLHNDNRYCCKYYKRLSFNW
jgi:hypothetical protein